MFIDRVDPINNSSSSPDLARRVAKAIGFARSTAELLLAADLPIDLKTYEASPDKLVAETAILADAVLSLKGMVADDLIYRADQLVRAILRQARSRQIAVACLTHPGLSRDYLAAHLVLGRCGYPDTAFEQLVKIASASDLASCRERLPHRRLEQAWLAYLGGASYEPAILAADTALAHPQDVLFSSRDDVYAFTHALMYVTDFGRLPLPPDLSADDLCMTADAALVAAMECDDFDLAGELLLIWPMTGSLFSDRAAFCFQVLCAIEDEVGILPSFSLDGREYRELKADAREHYKAAAGYHTVYVMGLLSALLIRSGVPITSFGMAPDVCNGATPLPETQKPPEWSRMYARLDARSQARIGAFAVDAELLSAARKMNLNSLHIRLGTARTDGYATLIQLQCAQLLQRLSADELTAVLKPNPL